LKPPEKCCVEVDRGSRKKTVLQGLRGFLAAVLLSFLLVVGCTSANDPEAQQAAASERASEEPNSGSRTAEEPTDNGQQAAAGAVARTGNAVARAGTHGKDAVARAGSASEKEDGIGTTRQHGVAALKIEGSSGTEFSGTCVVGSEESEIGGRVPQSFRYELHGRRLDCKIRKESSNPGVLRVVFNVGDHTNSVHETSTKGGTITLRYESDGVANFSSSTSVSGGKATSFSE
jgi:hypothetical protein